MRSSAILSLAALTAVAPVLAAPVASGPQYAKRDAEDSGAFAPAIFRPYKPGRWPFPTFPTFPGRPNYAVARADDESGAFWGTVLRWAPTIINAASKFFNKRDIEELLARGDDAQIAREFEEHLTRELVARGADDESGAFPWLPLIAAAPTIVNGASRLFKWIKGKREFEEFFARELSARADDESGAFWGTVLRWAPTIIKAVSSFVNKRDIEELLARGDSDLLSREFEDHLTREILARGDDFDLEAGALSIPWGAIVRAAPSVITAATNIWDIFKKGKRDLEGLSTREVEELFTRELVEQFAREDDLESGASLFGKIWKALPTVISIANRIINKREFEDVLARSILEARSLNELD